MLLLIPGSRHAASTCKPGFVVPSRARGSCFSRDREPATGGRKGGAKNCRASRQHVELPAHPTWTTSWLSSLPLSAGSASPRQLWHPKGSPVTRNACAVPPPWHRTRPHTQTGAQEAAGRAGARRPRRLPPAALPSPLHPHVSPAASTEGAQTPPAPQPYWDPAQPALCSEPRGDAAAESAAAFPGRSDCSNRKKKIEKKKATQALKLISKGLVMTILFAGCSPAACWPKSLDFSLQLQLFRGEQPGRGPMLWIPRSPGFLWKAPLIDMRK